MLLLIFQALRSVARIIFHKYSKLKFHRHLRNRWLVWLSSLLRFTSRDSILNFSSFLFKCYFIEKKFYFIFLLIFFFLSLSFLRLPRRVFTGAVLKTTPKTLLLCIFPFARGPRETVEKLIGTKDHIFLGPYWPVLIVTLKNCLPFRWNEIFSKKRNATFRIKWSVECNSELWFKKICT